MATNQRERGDCRYNSGDARVPWDAVAVKPDADLLRVDPAVAQGGIQALQAKLSAQGITQIAHFCPLYHYRLFQELGYDRRALQQSCPNAEQAFFEENTHLPLYGLPQASLDFMADAVTTAARELSA